METIYHVCCHYAAEGEKEELVYLPTVYQVPKCYTDYCFAELDTHFYIFRRKKKD